MNTCLLTTSTVGGFDRRFFFRLPGSKSRNIGACVNTPFLKNKQTGCLLFYDTFVWIVNYNPICSVLILTAFCCLLFSLNPCSKFWMMPARFQMHKRKKHGVVPLLCSLPSVHSIQGKSSTLMNIWFININNWPLHSQADSDTKPVILDKSVVEQMLKHLQVRIGSFAFA